MTLYEAVVIAKKALSDIDASGIKWSKSIEGRAWQLVLEAAEQSLTPANAPPSPADALFDQLLIGVLPRIVGGGSYPAFANSAMELATMLFYRRNEFLNSLNRATTKEDKA